MTGPAEKLAQPPANPVVDHLVGAASRVVDMNRVMGWPKMPKAGVLVAVVLAAAVPLVTSNAYILDVMILVLIFSILNLSWNIQLGMCGIWNFAHIAIYGIGGYTTAIVSGRYGVSPWLSMILAGLVCVVIGNLIMLPTLRLRGIYAGILTFAFSEMVRNLILSDGSGFTGGPFGLGSIPSLFPSLSAGGFLRAYYWLALAICVATALLVFALRKAPFGLSVHSLRDSTRYALGMGVSYRTSVLTATTVSSFIGGVAGALYASYYGTVSPSVMGLLPMSMYVLMIVIGGMGATTGPIVGTLIVVWLSELLRAYDQWRLILLGVIILVVLAFQPSGVVGLVSRYAGRLGAWMREEQHDSAEPDADH
jgi:branched-chain amino acid transport system permease protein